MVENKPAGLCLTYTETFSTVSAVNLIDKLELASAVPKIPDE